MRKAVHAVVIALIALSASAILAGARQDLRVETDKDDKGNVVYVLVNTGDKNVKATLQHDKRCSSTTSNKGPTEREHWLGPKARRQLRKVMANSDCRHTYRIVKAEYY